MADDGFIGVSGGKRFVELNDIEDVLEEIRFKLVEGFESRARMAEKRLGRER
ncbi:MAG: hypothetical protein LBT08_07385 [Synergistaceae bacterium]|nr:hypothetical protein [Synergistaceae bacterium]